MHIYLPIAEMSVNAALFLGMGCAVGFLSGLFGVGGGFLLTPLLIFMGVPSAVAVGTGSMQILASSVSGAIAQYRRNNVDVKMGMVLVAGGVVGSVIGVSLMKILRQAGQFDLFVSLSYVTFLGAVGALMLIESVNTLRRTRVGQPGSVRKTGQHSWVHGLPFKMRFHRSKLYISVIPPAMIGAFVGFMAAIMGVGGGFVMVPAMIYLLRVPTSVVIGTSLFQIVFVMAVTTLLQATAEQGRRRRAGAAAHHRRRHRRPVRRGRRRQAQGRAASLHARRARASRLPAHRLGPHGQAVRDLFDRPGSGRRLLMRRLLALLFVAMALLPAAAQDAPAPRMGPTPSRRRRCRPHR